MTAKILIVDDSGLSRRSLRRILESAGHQVIEAADGISALEIYYLEKPDLVMLDLLMQGMSGLEVLNKIRELDREAPIIVATADIQSSTREIVEASGANMLVNKPFVSAVVLHAVQSALEGGVHATH